MPRLWNVVEQRGLNVHEWWRLARRSRQYDRRARLIGALNQPDGELRTQGHDGAAPGLTGRGIAEAVRLKVISGIDEEALRSLIIDIQTSRTDETEKRGHAPVEATNAGHRLRGRGSFHGEKHQEHSRDEHEQGASHRKFMTDRHEVIIVWPTILVDQRGHA